MNKLNKQQKVLIATMVAAFIISVSVAIVTHRPNLGMFILRTVVIEVALFFFMNRFIGHNETRIS